MRGVYVYRKNSEAKISPFFLYKFEKKACKFEVKHLLGEKGINQADEVNNIGTQ